MLLSFDPPNQTQILTALIVLAVVVRFLVRELRERKLSLSQAFVLPGIIGLIGLFLAGTTVVSYRGASAALALDTVVALGVGSLVGLAVGHFTTVRLGAAAGTVYVRGSLITVGIWCGALALRLLARLAIPPHDPGRMVAADAALVLMLAAALAVLRYRMLVSARRAMATGLTAAVTVD